jgi:hypothetical protein
MSAAEGDDDPFEHLDTDEDVEEAPARGLGAAGQLLATLAAAVVLGLILLAAAAALGWIFR